MSTRHFLVAAVLMLLAPSCVRKQQHPVAAQTVHVFGSLHAMMHEGATGAVVSLGERTLGPHAYAIGALSELRGEVTVVDGAAWIAIAEGDGLVRTVRDASTESAALLVATTVESWDTSDVEVDAEIIFERLDAEIERRATAQGRDLSTPLPVLIEGPLANMTYHVIDGRRLTPGASHAEHAKASIQTTVANTDGTLIGFFSKNHEGIFTHLGSSTHLHAVIPASNASGHVDSVTIKRGARIRFPERQR